MQRRRRCDVCGARLAAPAPPRAAMRPILLHGSVLDGARSIFAEYLCDDCRARNDREEIDTRRRWAQESAALVERCADWLRQAPLLAELPAPIGAGTVAGLHAYAPFVEITDLESAARECADRLRGFRPDPLPTTYTDVLTAHHDEPPVRITEWTGSVYRLGDGRMAFHWRPRRVFRSS